MQHLLKFWYTNFVEIRLRFTQQRFHGSEAMGFVLVTLEMTRGISAIPFSVTVTPSEQSPVSARGNSVMCVLLCVDWRMFD